jgi:hypothetical protein
MGDKPMGIARRVISNRTQDYLAGAIERSILGEEMRNRQLMLRNEAQRVLGGVREARGIRTGYEYEGDGDYLNSGGPGVFGRIADRIQGRQSDRLERRIGRLSDRLAGKGGAMGETSQKAAAVEEHEVDRAYELTERKQALKLWMPCAIVAMASFADNAAFSNANYQLPVDLDCEGIFCDSPGIVFTVFNIGGTQIFQGASVGSSIFTGGNFQAPMFKFKTFLKQGTPIVVTGSNISGGEVNAGLYLLGYSRPSVLTTR